MWGRNPTLEALSDMLGHFLVSFVRNMHVYVCAMNVPCVTHMCVLSVERNGRCEVNSSIL